MKTLKTTAFAAIFAFASQAHLVQSEPIQKNLPYDTFGQTTAEKTLIKESWDAACNFSGLCKDTKIKNGYKNLDMYLLNDMMFIELNCRENPSSCMKMASVYNSDYQAIFIQDKVHPNKNAYNQSVLVHEMVHVQQERFAGNFDLINGSCYNLYNAEADAYNVQNKFLRSKGILGEEGRAFLTKFKCDAPTFPKLFVANNTFGNR